MHMCFVHVIVTLNCNSLQSLWQILNIWTEEPENAQSPNTEICG